jgi:hypothetical protein
VSFGSPRRPGLFIVAALVVVVALAVAIGTRRSTGRSALPTTTPSVPTTPATTARANTTSSIVATTITTAVASPGLTVAERTVVRGDGPLLASLTHTELIASGLDAVVRIDLDHGTVTRTRVTTIGSTGPTFMIAGSRSVLLRPMDNVTGYLVPDDGSPQRLKGLLGNGTVSAYPGPTPGLVWLELTDDRGNPAGLTLASFEADVAPTSTPILPILIPNLRTWGPDGAGEVVVVGVGGAYVTGPTGLTRVTTGDVVAAGPTTWLVRECDDHHACTIATIDRRTGAHAVVKVDFLADDPDPVKGVVSPDGATAAILHTGTGELDVVDLASGAQRNVAAVAKRVPPVWSLDSHFLFYVLDTYTISVFDRTSGITKGLYVEDQLINALAVRPAP